MKRWLWIGLAAITAVTALSVVRLRGVGAGPDLPVDEVRRESFVRRVIADGNLEAAESTKLTAPVTIDRPVMIAWLAEDGSRVKAGDVVARFDPTKMEQELADGESDRRTTQNRMVSRRVNGEVEQENLSRDAEMAERELRYAREFQSQDATIFSRSEMIESEIDERLATARQDHAVATRDARKELNQVELDLLEIERRKAELKIEKASKNLQDLEVTAPHDGIFVLRGRWGNVPTVGESVWRGQQIGELPQLDVMEAKVWVLEADAGGLKEGLEATVILDAHPGEVHQATVKQVDALPIRRFRQTPVQYFPVTLAFERTDPEKMKPGQRVQATLLLDELEEVLTIPRTAVFDKDGVKTVFVRRKGEFEPVEVTLGAAALGRVVVESGIEEGQWVALRDPTESLGVGGDEGEQNGPPGALR